MKNKEMILSLLHGGEFCGEMSLVDDGLRSATATATEDTVTLSLSRSEFEELRTQNPPLYLYLLDSIIRVICLRLRQANQAMEVIRFWLT
jgi:CRP/FNR family transcriptional regulator